MENLVARSGVELESLYKEAVDSGLAIFLCFSSSFSIINSLNLMIDDHLFT